MKEKIIKLIEDVLKVPAGTITEDTMIEDVEQWDSLAHVMIIGQLEEELGVSIPLDEAIELKGMRELLEKAGSESIRQGIAFICEDRRGKAMIPAFSVEENMMLSSIDRYTKSGWFQKRAADKKAMDMIEALKIKCVGVSQPAKELSGGNQQKVVFAKALLTEPSIWLCDEPTQAVDVATRQEIHRLLREEAKKGKAVLYVSSDLTELLEVADEVAVMAYGRVRKTFENKDLKPTDVLACCYEAEREESD